MDDLTYSYQGNSNKLLKVADAASTDTYGFKDDAVNTAADTADDYTYDVNGNLTTDSNKAITNISYNHLNLPTQVTFSSGNIQYIYDATGVKQKKIVSTGNITLYAGDYIYEGLSGSEVLQFFNTSEGYVEPINASNYALLFRHTFQYKDHLGNIRLSYKDLNQNTGAISLSIVEEHNYYPFGLKHNGYNGGTNGQRHHKYMFGGKELQDEIVGSNSFEVYDFGARNYDAALGRWMNVDPKASKFPGMSPYCAFANNPIYYIDPDGQEIVVPGEADRTAMLGYLNKTLGGDYFKFSDKNQLQFTGDIKDFKKDKKDIVNGMLGVINADYTATIKMSGFTADETKTLDEQSKPNVLGEKGGGVSLISVDNKTNKIVGATILIRESDLQPVPLFNEKYYYKDADGNLQTSDTKPVGVPSALAHQAQLKDGKPVTVPNTAANVIFHEIGHLIYEGGSQRDVLKYENKARKLMGMPQRSPSDPNHQ
jgi:RHS repeat-associated protein